MLRPEPLDLWSSTISILSMTHPIKSGSFKKVIDWILSFDYIGPSFGGSWLSYPMGQPQIYLHAFVISYQQVATPEELFRLLRRMVKRGIVKPALCFLVSWTGLGFNCWMVEDKYHTCLESRNLLISIHAYVHYNLMKWHSKRRTSHEGEQLRELDLLIYLANMVKSNVFRLLEKSNKDQMIQNNTKSRRGVGGRKFVVDYDPSDVALQLVLLDVKIFSSIHTNQLLHKNWKNNPKKAKGVLALIDRFNKVGFWVASEIVLTRTVEECMEKILFFINVAEKCVEVGAFNTLMAIISGLNNRAVKRLKHSWEGIKGHSLTAFNDACNLMSENKNFGTYRNTIKERIANQQPTLPFFGLYTQDLFQVEEQQKDFLSKRCINAKKLIEMGFVLLEIRLLQLGCSHYMKEIKWNDDIQDIFNSWVILPEESLLKRSKRLEK